MAKQGKFQSIRGVHDILPAQMGSWHHLEEAVREVFGAFGFCEIRLPVLEQTALFARSIGESTDIVEKEMYTFTDKSGEPVSLRPEGTAGVVRSYIEHNLAQQMRVAKLYYVGAMFRRERPMKGRFRQFHQIGAEVLGSAEPAVEVTLLVMLKSFFERLGLEGVRLEVNSLGGTKSRARYRRQVYDHFQPRIGDFCADCQRRIETNPLRILDCKHDAGRTQDAPGILDSLSAEDEAHWRATLRGLEGAGVSFEVNPRLVRGLDYYTRTVFEFTTDRLGTQNAVAAGGRYDGLVEQMGGPPTPAAGLAVGMERLTLLLEESQRPGPLAGPRLFIASVGEEAGRFALHAALDLARQGIRAEMDLSAGSLKSQMRQADRMGAEYVVVVGDEELRTRRAELKRLLDGRKEAVDLGALAKRLA